MAVEAVDADESIKGELWLKGRALWRLHMGVWEDEDRPRREAGALTGRRGEERRTE